MKLEKFRASEMQRLADHLEVIICGDEKLVFSRGRNLGYISDNVLYVDEDHWTGGKLNTVFVDQDITILKETYQLEGATTAGHVAAIEGSIEKLGDLLEALEDEDDSTKARALFDSAKAVVAEFPSETAEKILEKIRSKAGSVLIGSKPAKEATKVVEEPELKVDPPKDKKPGSKAVIKQAEKVKKKAADLKPDPPKVEKKSEAKKSPSKPTKPRKAPVTKRMKAAAEYKKLAKKDALKTWNEKRIRAEIKKLS